MSIPTQIGWYNLSEDTTFCNNNYECAAWYENIAVPKGRYPINVYDIHKNTDGRIYSNSTAYITMEGTIVSDYFGALFCGMPISDYDSEKNKGKKSTYTAMPYLFMVVDSIVNDQNSPYELFPEYEVRKYNKEHKGETTEYYGIFMRTNHHD